MFSLVQGQGSKPVRFLLTVKRLALGFLVLSALLSFKCDLVDFSDPPYRDDHVPGQDLPITPQSLTITSSGLTNGDVLLTNLENSDTLSVTGVGNFTFPTQVDALSPFDIEITQNNTFPPQACLLANGTGLMPFNETDNITLTCSENTYAISGTISGLAGTTSTDLVLQLNGGNDLTVTGGSTTFAFPQEVPENSVYNVTVSTNPAGPSQNCTASAANGIVPVYNTPYDPSSGLKAGTGDVTDVAISCITNTFSVGFNVAGLAGAGLQVSLESPPGTSLETKSIDVNGDVIFSTVLDDGSSYSMVVNSNPTGLNQTCSFNITGGTLGGADVSPSTHTLTCTTTSYSVSANVTGVDASNTITLSLNGAAGPTVSTPGVVSLGSLPDGSSYTVINQGTTGTISCAINPASGVISGSNLTVDVTCSVNTWTVSGTILNYLGTGMVLQLNGGNDLTIAGGATTFSFASTPLAEGSNYTVSVFNHPGTTLQLCTITNGSGTNILANISNVVINCAADSSPTVSVSTSTTGYFEGGTTFLTGTYTDDSQNSVLYPSYLNAYSYSYNWQTSTSGCSISGGTSVSASVNCTWGAEEAARQVSVRVGFSDGRNTMVYSSYVLLKVYNPSFMFATPSGSTVSTTAGFDPDVPASIQRAITNASGATGRTKVAVMVGTYNFTSQTAVTMSSGVSVYGRFATNWFSRYTKSTVNHLNAANSSILTHNYTSTWGKAFYFYNNNSSTVLDGMTVVSPDQLAHYGFYISSGNPVIRNNYYVSNTTTGLSTSAFQYGVVCMSCYALVEKNFIDLYYGAGVIVNTAATNQQFKFFNNIIRIDQGHGIRIYYTGSNDVYFANNVIMNRYATKSSDGTAIYIYGTTTTNEPHRAFVANNLIYAQYGVYEASTYANPYRVYDNNFYGPTGFSAYYDRQANCTANGDLDNNSYTCSVADGQAAWTVIAVPWTSGGFFYDNFGLNSSIRYSISYYTIGSPSDAGYYIGDYYGSDTTILYGAGKFYDDANTYPYWSFSDDFTGTARTYTIPSGNVWTSGTATLIPSGASVGAFER